MLPEDYAKRIQDLIDQGDFKGAINLCDKMIGEYPNNPMPHIKKGIAHMKMSNKNAAQTSFKGAIQIFGGAENIPPPLKETLKSYGFNPDSI